MANNEKDVKHSNKLDYTRRLYKNLLYWYDSAEKKAHILLTLDGAFLTFISSSIFLKKELIVELDIIPLLLLGMMSLSLILSIFFALYSLYSQISLFDIDKSQSTNNQNNAEYQPQKIWFFQDIMQFERDIFIKSLDSINDDIIEIIELGSQIHILSSNVNRKHRRVDLSFICCGFTLIFFFTSALSYSFL